MLGGMFAGRLVTDRWCAYTWVASTMRQICWAHLLRDFQWMVDHRGLAAALAQKILDETKLMFALWHRFRERQLTRAELQAAMVPIRAEIGRLLRRVHDSYDADPSGMCREILVLEAALWTFVDVEGVEPLNNAAERAIRPAVIWRKVSFGTDSAHGSLFVERILSARATLRAQRCSCSTI